MKKAATKKVSEKKTKETYASKASMMKHEKGESKKMKMKEGEIPMMKKGGMKMYADGGKKKPSVKKFRSSYIDPTNLSDVNKSTTIASKNGKIVKRTNTDIATATSKLSPAKKGYEINEKSTTVVDTAGYAAGKKSFPVKRATKQTLSGSKPTLEYKKGTISRKGVETMFKDGGKKKPAHRGFHVVQKEIAAKQGISMEAAGAILASSARKASPEAIKKNKRLLKISGVGKAKKK